MNIRYYYEIFDDNLLKPICFQHSKNSMTTKHPFKTPNKKTKIQTCISSEETSALNKSKSNNVSVFSSHEKEEALEKSHKSHRGSFTTQKLKCKILTRNKFSVLYINDMIDDDDDIDSEECILSEQVKKRKKKENAY